MRVGLFLTCLNDTLFPGAGKAVVQVLERLGHEVVFPPAQTCCGQAHFNTGYRRECVPLARKFAKDFAGLDHVVSPSASCVAMVRENYRELVGESPPVYEFSEFLVDVLGVTDVGAAFPHRVTYHPTCHGLRLLDLGDRPTALLRAVRGLRLVDLPDATHCCGFGGTFALKNADTSVAMGTDKARNVLGTGAEVLAAVDNSCLMHIGGLLSRWRSGTRVLHVAEILAAT
ncbi:(Fe-S)-binding protein [Actinokineospora globicatena]|uniref:Fe-S oxidoreductase n=1 Tax=Actinokineospora globicatena TaxID=103729 RepID=A0A9W6QSJ6_9PSEU|nr:(Fe-S)-binding protein [Actinokineospora globicatena]MCP2305101.1 L-lactate dehydrogenase complex protein LldE [Actinokineospora globicatena]GLW80566.1 Fe-S oxidoreductase [Actinokineospora globicatena]GLW87394.1 Fe-S oxidoreductase [Actinokineospora globicatena]GLW93884.1 Fe-S oxidoreductase [Actinokineospora globicatena]